MSQFEAGMQQGMANMDEEQAEEAMKNAEQVKLRSKKRLTAPKA